MSRPEHDGAPLSRNRSRDLRVRYPSPTYHTDPAHDNTSSPAPAGCLIDVLLLVSLLLLCLGYLPVSHWAYALNLAAG